MEETLGDRMKGYENISRIYLPRRSYIIFRIDGRAFHTYTRGLDRPFDSGFIEDMNQTASYLCENISGAKFAFVQSDEISILVTDFETIKTEAWFDNNIQKMCSLTASMATSKFNQLRMMRKCMGGDIDGHLNLEDICNFKLAEFDSRVWQIPSSSEVENYFIFRQRDCTKNSIASVAQSLYSHKELNGKNGNDQQEMIFQKGINWNDYSVREKRGGFIERVIKPYEVSDIVIKTRAIGPTVLRTKWETVECPVFTQDREFLSSRIPKQ